MAGLVLLAGLLALPACGPDPAESLDLTQAQFIDVVAAIRNAEIEVSREDSAAALFQAKKDSILAAHGVTEAELEEFLNLHSDPQTLDALWDSLTQRLKRPLATPRDGPVVDEDERPDSMPPPKRPPLDGLRGRIRR